MFVSFTDNHSGKSFSSIPNLFFYNMKPLFKSETITDLNNPIDVDNSCR